jgi:adenylate kinase
MVAISELFSLLGSPKSKLLILHAGSECSGSVFSVSRSLISEHVNSEALLRAERGRQTPIGAALRRAEKAHGVPTDETVLAVMRRWFFGRSADRGFALIGFPQNRRQALAFDEWLEARGETLDACLHPSGLVPVSPEVIAHYRDLGLLTELPVDAIDVARS